MKFFPHYDDAAYIQLVRRRDRQRRPLGILMLAAGALFIAAWAYFLNSAAASTHHVQQLLTAPTPNSAQQTALAFSHAQHLFYFFFGVMVSGAGFIGSLLIVLGLGLICVRDRKAKMLLDAWDRPSRDT